ncbi:MAG: hypothetical protein RSD46_01535 [Oscillospiraceae bacterium]
MEEDRISARQRRVLLFAALLVPAVALPGRLAEAAGDLSWLVPLLCIPAALLLCWMLGRLGDLPATLRRVWGGFFGGALTLIYSTWCFFLLILYLKGLVSRLVLIGAQGFAPILFAAVALGIALHMARGTRGAFCRGTELFYLVLAVVLGGILLLGIFHIKGENLWSFVLPTELVGGIAPMLGVVSLGTLGALLVGNMESVPGDKWRRYGWTTGFCVTVALITLVVVGRLGAPLTAALPAPFFTLVQGLGVAGMLQRVEGAVAALWVLSDLALLGLLLFGLRGTVGAVCGQTWGRRILPAAAMAALLLGALMSEELAVGLRNGVAQVNLVLGFLVPAATLLVARLTGR